MKPGIPDPRLSVVIPTHNRCELLSKVLQALTLQTYPANQFEAVVVVDGSEDGTVEMLRSLTVPYRLAVHFQKQGGAARSRNAGIERADGEIILFIDDDVVPFPGLIEEHLRCHQDDENAVVIGCLASSVEAKRSGWTRFEEQLLTTHFANLSQKPGRITGRHLFSANFSVRRKHLLSVGGFDETMRLAEDSDLGCKLQHIGLCFHFNPYAAGIHYGHHSYDAWRNRCYLYGRMDVVMGRSRPYPTALSRWRSTFHAASALTRHSVALCLDRKRRSKLFLGLLERTAFIGDTLRLYHMTKPLYNGIAVSLYWQGVCDELGGSAIFWQEMAHSRPVADRHSQDLIYTN